jgi:hypothetical protein
MTRKTEPRHAPPPAPADEPEAVEPGPILERPDGYYWQALDGQAEFGPFASHQLARADRDAPGDERTDSGETLREAERDIGINEWIDVETGQPAEGQSPPHLEEE